MNIKEFAKTNYNDVEEEIKKLIVSNRRIGGHYGNKCWGLCKI